MAESNVLIYRDEYRTLNLNEKFSGKIGNDASLFVTCQELQTESNVSSMEKATQIYGLSLQLSRSISSLATVGFGQSSGSPAMEPIKMVMPISMGPSAANCLIGNTPIKKLEIAIMNTISTKNQIRTKIELIGALVVDIIYSPNVFAGNHLIEVHFRTQSWKFTYFKFNDQGGSDGSFPHEYDFGQIKPSST